MSSWKLRMLRKIEIDEHLSSNSTQRTDRGIQITEKDRQFQNYAGCVKMKSKENSLNHIDTNIFVYLKITHAA